MAGDVDTWKARDLVAITTDLAHQACLGVDPGVILWASPTGFTYLVTPSGTHKLHVPTRPVGPRPTDGGLTPGQRRDRERAAHRNRKAAAEAKRANEQAAAAQARAAQAPPLFG